MRTIPTTLLCIALSLALNACAQSAAPSQPVAASIPAKPLQSRSGEMQVRVIANGLQHPWAVALLPDGGFLVTERPGRLRRISADGNVSAPIAGTPAVFAEGQGGLLDVALDPGFAGNKRIWLSFAEPGESEQDFSSRLAAELEEMILREGPDTVAAFIAEPVMGAGGAITPPDGYFEKVNAVLAKYDILFISDEVITGFGRTGKMFGTETYGMAADSISLAKQITSAYFPLSAVMMNDRIYDVLVDQSRKIGTFGHGFTASGHPVATAVGLENLKIIEERDLIGNAARMGAIFQARLAELADHPLVGEVRGAGLIAGIEMVADKETRRPFAAAGKAGARAFAAGHEHGLIVRAIGDVVALCPPLIITEEQVHETVNRLHKALDDTARWRTEENLN